MTIKVISCDIDFFAIALLITLSVKLNRSVMVNFHELNEMQIFDITVNTYIESMFQSYLVMVPLTAFATVSSLKVISCDDLPCSIHVSKVSALVMGKTTGLSKHF